MWLAIFAAAVAVVSALKKGQQDQQAYEAQAQANQYDAAVKRQRAETTTQVYGQQEEQQRRYARILEGRRYAAAAQSGAGLGGSNQDFERQSEMMAELDALNIRYEGQLEAKGLLDSATLDDYSADMNRKSGKYARQQGFLNAASAALSGYSSYSKIANTKTTTTNPGSSGKPTMGLYGNYSGGNIG